MGLESAAPNKTQRMRGIRKGRIGTMSRKGLSVLGVLLAFVLAAGGQPRFASAENLPNTMKVVRTFGGEEVEDAYKLMGGCVNRRMSYRLMQVLERNQCEDHVFRPYDLSLRSEWMFGCALNFFQREKYTGEDQGIWLNWRFAMTAGAPKFQFSGRSRSSGERFLCTPPKAVAEDLFTVTAEWNKRLGKRWRDLRAKLMKEILEADFQGKKPKDLTEEEQEKLFEKLNAKMAVEWPQLLNPEEKQLDDESNRLGGELERVLTTPQEKDYEYRVLEKGVSVPVLVRDGKLKYDGGTLELKGRDRGLTETMLFRMVQIASGLWPDGVFRSGGVTIETGWNDPKVKAFLADELKVPADKVRMGAAGTLTAGKDLTLADAWFRITAASTGKTLLFRATERMLSPRYFELKDKSESTTAEENRLAKAAQASPFLGGFEVRDHTAAEKLNDVLYGNKLVHLGQDGSKAELELDTLIQQIKGTPNVSADSLFNAVAGFRSAQLVSQAWNDKVFNPSDVAVTVGPVLGGTNPGDFWASLGVADVKTDAGAGDGRLRATIRVKSTGDTYTIRETEDLGRRDYANLKAYADKIRPIAEKEKGSGSVGTQGLAADRAVSALGTVQAAHAHTGWRGALHITEESMEALEENLISVPSVGYVLVSKEQKPGGSEPGTPKPDAPKPGQPKPDAPKPNTPKPDVPKPDAPKPDVGQRERVLGDFLKAPKNWNISETRLGAVTRVSLSIRFETDLDLKTVRLMTQGFRQETVKAELIPAVAGKSFSAAAAGMRTYTLKASGEFDTADRDKAAITGIRYTTADDATERELPLPSSGIPLSEMKQAAPEGEKKSGSSSGCDAGFLSLAVLALVPVAVRSGRRSR